jgi:UDP-glucose 4-epimerase
MALLADSTRLAADAGWRPRVDLRDGLARTVAWWEKRLIQGQVRRDDSFMT